jgi:hypothetical protein
MTDGRHRIASWSNKYQWLPANVFFRDDGTVGFTSYINNLHPTKYPEIYTVLERLIDAVLPAWDQCLKEQMEGAAVDVPGRATTRFSRTKGVEQVSLPLSPQGIMLLTSTQ